MKVVTIHQPNYLPWLGFFSKIKHSNCFVILDNVKYTKNGIINRNKIRAKEGWFYLTIPIERKYYDSKICEVKLPIDNRWKKTHWNAIETNYKKASHFKFYKEFLEKLYKNDFEFLWQMNEEIIFWLFKCFDISVEIVKASELNLDPKLKKTHLLIEILKEVGADSYLSGPSGRNYLEFDKFEENGLRLDFFNFKHPTYKQRYLGFEPYMTSIDLLFNLGEDGKKLI